MILHEGKEVLAVQAHIKKRFKKEVIQIPVSYETIKKNKTLGDFDSSEKKIKADSDLSTSE